MRSLRFIPTACLLLVALYGLGSMALAQSPTAVASLSPSEVAVGEVVELRVKIDSVGKIRLEPINVEGVQVRGSRTQTNISMGTRSGAETTLIFSLVLEREGEIAIPTITLEVGGRKVRTEPLKLKVRAAGTAQKQGGAAGDPAQSFLELVLPKQTAYVGETVPVEVRLHVAANVHWQPETMPQIAGEGFTTQKMPEPRQEHGRRNGREYDVLVFRTAITPSRAGSIKLGPVQMSFIARVPRAQRSRPQSLFDLLDQDMFSDPFFATNQRLQATSEAVELEVKPLPATGRPQNFSGAVGQFKLQAQGSPDRVKVGDPVTMQLSVTGGGNFDRMEAPVIEDTKVWRAYPPSAKFKAEDDLGITGKKTFEIAAIPEQKTSTMPTFAFTYFDPVEEKYVTLKNQPGPLVVEGSVAFPPPVVAAPADSEPAAAPAPSDIAGLRYDEGRGARSFEPLYARPAFWAVQAVPLLVLLGFAGGKLRRKNEDAGRVAALRREKGRLLARLRAEELPRTEFLEMAARVIQLETAEITGRQPESVDASVARSVGAMDDETAGGIDEIFSSRAELLYAGGGSGDERLAPADRARALATVEAFGRSHARR